MKILGGLAKCNAYIQPMITEDVQHFLKATLSNNQCNYQIS